MSWNSPFDLSDMANLNQAISYFSNSLLNQLRGLTQQEEVKSWVEEKKIVFSKIGLYEEWSVFDIYNHPQTWGSTAGGWGGMGGAAMTTYQTTCIHNKRFGIIAVFWEGRLAYVVKDTEYAVTLMQRREMPGYNGLGKTALIYKPTTRNNY